ncbi:uncharacterized protein LOC131930204, partial [Physella acuta]|uniref:uncharacterized protein LOC131930204 n=1 Tax=Physella acuta TaxID=109671 RepID=UPI0027DE5123
MDYNEFLGRDETLLRNLLERSSSFPERRKIRAALKRFATPGTQPSSLNLHNGHAQTPIRRSNSEAEVKRVRLTNRERRINGKCRDETFSQNEAEKLEACSHSVPADLCSLDVAGSSTDSGYYCDDQDSSDNQVTNMATTAVPQMTPEFGPDQRRRSSMIMGAYRVIKRNSVMLSESGLPSSPSPKSADAHAALQMANDINNSLQRRGSMGAGTNQRPRSHSVYPDHVTSPSWKQISSSSSANTASPPHPALLATHKARRRESYHVTSATKPDHDRSLHNPANHPTDNPVRLDFEGNLRKHYPSPTSGSRHVTSAAQNEARKSRSESFSALRAKGRQLLSESETHSVPLSESARVLNSEASKTHTSESSRVLSSETLKPHTSASSRVLTPEPPATSHSTGSHTEPNTTNLGSPDLTDATSDAATDQRTKSKFLSDLYSGQKKMTHLLNRSKSLLKVNELSKRQTQPIDQLLQSDFHRSSDDWPRNPPASTSAAEHLNGSHTGGDRNPPTTKREDVTNSILNSLPPLGFTSSNKVQTNYDVKGRASGDDHGDVRSVDSPFHRPREPSLSFEDVFTPGVSPGVSPAGQAVYKSTRRSSGHDVFDFSTQHSQTRSSSAKSFPPNLSPSLAKKLVKPSTEYRRFSFPDTSLDASEKLAEALKNVKNIQSKYTSHSGGSKYTSHPGGSKYTSHPGGSKDKRRGSLYSPQFLSDGPIPSSHALTSDDRKSRDIYLHPMSDLKPRRVPSSVGQRAVTQHVDQAHLRSHISDHKESRFDSRLVNQVSALDYSAAADDDSFDETDAVAYLKSTVRRASSSIVDYSRSKSRRGSTPAATDTRSRLLTETGLAGSRDMIAVDESAERNRAKMLEVRGHHLRSTGIQESSPVASSDHSDVSSVSAGPGLSSAHSYKGLTGLHELQKLLSQTADSAERTKIRNVIRQLRHNYDA